MQNIYNLTNRGAEALLDHCEREGIGFIPWFPLATGELPGPAARWTRSPPAPARRPSQVALAWLLRRSPVMLPIPGTGSVEHLEENMSAADITLTDEQFARAVLRHSATAAVAASPGSGVVRRRGAGEEPHRACVLNRRYGVLPDQHSAGRYLIT